MLISRKLILLLGALSCGAVWSGAASSAQSITAPLVVRLTTPHPVFVSGASHLMTISITNISSRPLPAPNLNLKGHGHDPFLIRGYFRPRVYDSRGRRMSIGFVASFDRLPTHEERFILLQPGKTIRASFNMGDYWNLWNRPGDYAVTTPVVTTRTGKIDPLQQLIVSNTCFLRVLPRDQRALKSQKGLSLLARFTLGDRTVWSRQAPTQTKDTSYIPLEVAAKLLSAKIQRANGRITLKRDGQTLAFLTREQTVVLPSGKRLKDLGLVMAGKQVMLPQKALEQAFGPMTGLTWGIRPKS